MLTTLYDRNKDVSNIHEKGEDMIRKISLVILVLAWTSTAAFSMGTIHLFADATSHEISSDISELGTQNVWIVYAPTDEEGLDCIRGLEFMVHWDATHLVQIYSPVFNSFVSVTQGLIRSGISVAFSRDVSIEDGYLFVGYFTLMGLQDIVKWTPLSRLLTPLFKVGEIPRVL